MDTVAFRRGFMIILPLWLATAPVALTYVTAAQKAGFSGVEIQLASVLIYSAPTQLALVELVANDASKIVLLVTILMLNLQFVLYGFSLSQRMHLTGRQRTGAALLLTDTAYAFTLLEDRNAKFPFLIGAGASMWVAWNICTALSILMGQFMPDEMRLFDFIVPLTFFVMLCYLMKTSRHAAVAILAVWLTLGCLVLGLGSLTVIVVGIVAPVIGVSLHLPTSESR